MHPAESLLGALYGADLTSWIKHTHPDIFLELQLDTPVSLVKPNDPQFRPITVVRAPMGSGKTTALLDWLKHVLQSPDVSVLVVSCRRSFTQTLIKRFNAAGLSGFVTYLTSDSYIMGFKRLIVQLESLHRVSIDAVSGYDILILDEVMSVIGQLYSPTMKRLVAVDNLLYRLLTQCAWVIAMDATINSEFINIISSLRGDANIHVVLCTYAGVGFSSRTCTFLADLGADALIELTRCHSTKKHYQAKRGSFFDELFIRLRFDQNICVFCSTLSFSELVARFCLTFTESVLVLNASQPLCDVSEWKRFKVVIYTTVVTVGLSFDAVHFHSMFAYIKPMAYGPDMVSVYQSLGRVRSLILNELLIYFDGSRTKCGPLFFPMLLNHEVVNWTPSFTQVTNNLCCEFKKRCKGAFIKSNAYLFSKFKYKHLFERCTLWSLADSVNILHTLLQANNILVILGGIGPITDVPLNIFCDFIKNIRLNATFANVKIRSLKNEPVNINLQEIQYGAIIDRVMCFMDKYLINSCYDQHIDLLRALAQPIEQNRFVNIVILGACLRVPESCNAFSVFEKIYNYYTSGDLLFIDEQGEFNTINMISNAHVFTQWQLFCCCVDIAKTIQWNPTVGGCLNEIVATDLHIIIEKHRDALVNLLTEAIRCNIIDLKLLTRPLWNITGRIDGRSKRRGNIPTQTDYNISLFRLVWEQLFGARVIKSKKTFPINTRVKNLTKNDIQNILDSVNIDRAKYTTRKQLYSLLMKHKMHFSEARFMVAAPKWARSIYFTQTENCFQHPVANVMLEKVLAELAPSSWPKVMGALDFENL
ncbi:origin binding protein [Cercopithecine alphaherpesvirus 9]|uniref:Replication origin-binding protein n=1 Tax=Cercopithecine herpesvirus 9 (strain DHV) TaxID=36348 RepID=Q9E1W9_CHV9D|nr:DNA replication origin-binding helicase [Cercopithecine alphaherpesvirus 9]AAG27226.1 origin binding protein [Cercopithecine alphaherpesvirus 9]